MVGSAAVELELRVEFQMDVTFPASFRISLVHPFRRNPEDAAVGLAPVTWPISDVLLSKVKRILEF